MEVLAQSCWHKRKKRVKPKPGEVRPKQKQPCFLKKSRRRGVILKPVEGTKQSSSVGLLPGEAVASRAPSDLPAQLNSSSKAGCRGLWSRHTWGYRRHHAGEAFVECSIIREAAPIRIRSNSPRPKHTDDSHSAADAYASKSEGGAYSSIPFRIQRYHAMEAEFSTWNQSRKAEEKQRQQQKQQQRGDDAD